MNTIAILELHSWSEIAALIGIISLVWGALSALLVMWLNTKYVGKKAYYADRREAEEVVHALDKRLADIERAQALASAPITALQASVNAMQAQLEKLTAIVGNMKESVTQGLHDIDKRTAVIEAAAKGKGGRGGGAGR